MSSNLVLFWHSNIRYDFAYKRCSVRRYPRLVVRCSISYLCCLLYFGYWCHTWLYVYHGGYLAKWRNCVPFASIWVHPRLLMGSVFCLVYFCIACLRTVCCVPNGLPILDPQVFDRVSDVNFFSFLFCVVYFLPHNVVSSAHKRNPNSQR